jgi:hypothetical protein
MSVNLATADGAMRWRALSLLLRRRGDENRLSL